MSEQRIYKAICEAMKDIEPVAKNRENRQQGFQYRGIDDVMTELAPVLTRHGIFIVPEVLEQTREERNTKNGAILNYSIQKTAFHFTADDGSKVTAVVIGEGADSGDKASNKALAAAFKYACLQVFCIPTNDPKDPDGESLPPGSAKRGRAMNQDEIWVQMMKITDKIKIYTKMCAPDSTPYFSREEIDIIKDVVNKTRTDEGGIKTLEEQLGKVRAALGKRQAALENKNGGQ
jgi:hypothetical protein